MFFDYQQQIVVGGIQAYPDYAFVDVPKQASQLIETNTIQGNNSTGAISITGSVDS